ncbi:hypothetical protein CPLU01_12702 [Colletotrichum plurivorum]|uniref:D-isomer specific 2-hydroxyacid dehydrogenase NAD-binding domain-containing protein n=1 Tax=Colletotrichum plurivorum TaxID=2175906 RepID=A0A8H6JXQ2_9PEZI|nr:hypothetical protein CPLU01_12702 [Colletotrichum plurivorum]
MALCLALSVAREVPQIVLRQRVGGEAIRKETVSGLLLSGRVVGVVGMGYIGQAVTRMFQGWLGCSVVAFDPYFPTDGERPWDEIAHRRVESLDELLDAADVVTVHVPLNAGTRDLIAAPQLKRMKITAILPNTARGGVVVNEDDLADEPPTLERYERLWQCPRLVGTPHIAAATDETQVATINVVTDKLYSFLMEERSGNTK